MDTAEAEIPVTVDDMAEMDAYFAEQERQYKAATPEDRFQEALTGKHTMSGAQAPLDWREMNQQAEPLQWGPWQ